MRNRFSWLLIRLGARLLHARNGSQICLPLTQARRLWKLGYFTAAAMLARIAYEQAIKDALAIRGFKQRRRMHDNLVTLRDAGFMDKEASREFRRLFDYLSSVAHGRDLSAKEARSLIERVYEHRAILRKLAVA